MTEYQTYQSNAAEIPIMRKWLLRALFISLLLHAGLILFFNLKELENFGYMGDERLAPPVNVMTRAVIIPDMPDEDAKLTLPDNKPKAQIALPDDKPTVDEVHVMPSAPEATAPIVQEKPKVNLTGFESHDLKEANSIAALEKQLSGVAGSLVDKSVRSPRQPVIKIPVGNKPGEGGAGDSGGIPGRQSLDEALGKAGGPVSGKPVAMRGGALFEHGKADLLPDAVLDLQKLGQLIRRNPKSTFIISGHTDHTGTYEGNLILSQQRADAVRYWLVSNLGIDPARITTIGKADTEAFPDLGPDKSIEEQAPNRRVEIVIKTNRN
jgi:outer membrane protein OmpA-like peptidoglycan-associated protein